MNSLDRPLPKSPVPESPTDSGMRAILVSALDRAREAVRLDTKNEGPKALVKYSESVWLLRELLERMRAGGASPRHSWALATGAEQQKEEAKLQAILDTYTVRIAVLREAYGVGSDATLEVPVELWRIATLKRGDGAGK
ncbi:hypothetical protein DXG01_006137 [Tephrocybe rancida]|nr:hypothetical protein DXG01_006137 [Tephrocybe rancida]